MSKFVYQKTFYFARKEEEKKVLIFLFFFASNILLTYSPVTGGLRNVVSGSARYTMAISSTVKPILCMWIVRNGSKDALAR